MSDITTYFTLIKSIKDNLPNFSEIESKFAEDYNNQVKSIEKLLKTDLSLYVIPNSEFYHRVTSIEMGYPGEEGRTNYSENLYINRNIFLMKLDALLMRFTITQQDIKIGFSLN